MVEIGSPWQWRQIDHRRGFWRLAIRGRGSVVDQGSAHKRRERASRSPPRWSFHILNTSRRNTFLQIFRSIFFYSMNLCRSFTRFLFSFSEMHMTAQSSNLWRHQEGEYTSPTLTRCYGQEKPLVNIIHYQVLKGGFDFWRWFAGQAMASVVYYKEWYRCQSISLLTQFLPASVAQNR